MITALKYVAFSAAMAASLAVPVASAQTSSAAPVSPPPAELYATVGINNAVLKAQNGNTFTISFDLANREGVQPDVRYAVVLTQNGKVVDLHPYDDKITLGTNDSVSRTISYTAPATFAGTYSLALSVRNGSGTPFASAAIKNVTLKSSSGLAVDPGRCYITSAGDEHHFAVADYNIFSPNAALTLHCTVKNDSAAEATLSPALTERIRSFYGDLVVDSGTRGVSVSVPAHTSQEFTVAIPPKEEPQSYYATMNLRDPKGVSTNGVFFKYVIRGVGASIRSLLLDKSSYARGDTAIISFMWSPLVDSVQQGAASTSMPVASTAAVFSITDQNGRACADPVNYQLKPTDVLVHVNAPITADCASPHVTASIQNVQAGTLDSQSFSAPTRKSSMNLISNIYLWGILLGLLGIAAVYLVRTRRLSSGMSRMGPPLALLILGIGLFAGAGQAQASSASYVISRGCATPPCAVGTNLYFAVNVGDTQVAGQPIQWSFNWGSDDFPFTNTLNTQGSLNGGSVWSSNLTPGNDPSRPGYYNNAELATGFDVFNAFIGNAPTTPGSYAVTVKTSPPSYSTLPYTVPAPPSVQIQFI